MEVKEPDAECIVCKSPIRSDAKVCLECKSRQDWTRYFDVGNTSLSLLIAAFSVFALATTAAIQAVGFFADKKKASVTVNVDDAGPESLSLFIGNGGPGLAIVSPVVICTVRTPRLGKEWFDNHDVPANPDYSSSSYMYSVKGQKSFLLQPGTHQIVELKGARMDAHLAKEEQEPPTDKSSFCWIRYKDQGGRPGGAVEEIEDIWGFVLTDASPKKPAPGSGPAN